MLMMLQMIIVVREGEGGGGLFQKQDKRQLEQVCVQRAWKRSQRNKLISISFSVLFFGCFIIFIQNKNEQNG